jgi:hypothetical protein
VGTRVLLIATTVTLVALGALSFYKRTFSIGFILLGFLLLPYGMTVIFWAFGVPVRGWD